MTTKQALVDAVCYDDLATLQHLLNSTRDAGAVAAALRVAIEHGRRKAVALLTVRVSHVEVRALDGTTPLMWAASAGDLEMVRLLLDAGADANAADIAGWSPLFYAARHQHLRVVHELVGRGADVERVDVDGHSALDIATEDRRPRGPFLPGADRQYVETPVASYLRRRVNPL